MVPEIIENLQQTNIVENESIELLGLQTSENWLVIVVDFPDFPSSDAVGVRQAENILTEQGTRYVSELSGNQSSLSLTVYPEVILLKADLVNMEMTMERKLTTGVTENFCHQTSLKKLLLKQKIQLNGKGLILILME